MEIQDQGIREDLSKILGSYQTKSGHGNFDRKEVKVLSWIEIAYEIGKLKQAKESTDEK